MAVKVWSLGAAQEVTGSKHLFEVDGRQYLIDCGAFQGKRKESDEKNRNFTVDIDKLEAVISYIAEQVANLFKVKLMKMLWLIETYLVVTLLQLIRRWVLTIITSMEQIY